MAGRQCLNKWRATHCRTLARTTKVASPSLSHFRLSFAATMTVRLCALCYLPLASADEERCAGCAGQPNRAPQLQDIDEDALIDAMPVPLRRPLVVELLPHEGDLVRRGLEREFAWLERMINELPAFDSPETAPLIADPRSKYPSRVRCDILQRMLAQDLVRIAMLLSKVSDELESERH